ncbi:hypothetical protein GMA11_04355 [Granulicatella sp. zg-ZJ]|uniref:Rha family transcriptional regulator n=1 Tax=Granulicatella sp. zg-ZJ TaxID=2678504 RepID=UPI0013D1F15B|nr:Rha family transcriptional regulator [Granulicatella sp. zg-ZJ]NEW62621.1 hypothetical protein [Granulicatella sp. zg-ZJ]
MELVYIDGKKEPYTLSSIVADCADVKRHTVTRTIRKNIERFGKVGFKIQPMKSGQHSKDYILNEQQATLLITFLKNTEQVADFKEKLVKAFFELRKEVENFKISRALEKPQRKTLMDAIKNWRYNNPWSYKAVTDLLLKKVTGLNARQLRVTRKGKGTALDLLKAEELNIYSKYENLIISLIELNTDYETTKQIVLGA